MIRLAKYLGNQNEFPKHPKIKWLDGGLEPFNFRMLKEFVLISLICTQNFKYY